MFIYVQYFHEAFPPFLSFHPFPPLRRVLRTSSISRGRGRRHLSLSLMSRFRAEDADGRGAGGKAPRLRRTAPAVPYLRPEVPPPALACDPAETRGWLYGLVSGAGRLLSAVFGSESSGSDGSSCSCSDDSSDYLLGDEFDDEDYRYASDVHGDLDQPGSNLALIEDPTSGHVPLASMSKSKYLIEQLIWQETFTRNECSKLMEIIQSRVVDSPNVYKGSSPPYNDLQRKFFGEIATPTVVGLGQTYGPNTRSLVPDSFLCTGSSKSFADQVHSPEFCDRAIGEAKKWVEEKRAGNLKSDLDCGPCTLNTEMYQYDTDSDRGSPVALSKSYMRVLPPWQSPKMTTTSFSSPSVEVFREIYESLDSVFPTLSPLKSTNRNRFSGGLLDTVDVTQKYQRRTMKVKPASPLSRRNNFSDGKQDYACMQNSFVTDGQNPEMLQTARGLCVSPATYLPDVHMNLPTDFAAKDSSGVKSAAQLNYSIDNELFRTGISEINHVQISRGEAVKIIGMEGSCPTKEKACSITYCKTAVVDPSCTELNVLAEDCMNAEPIAIEHENSHLMRSRSPSTDADQTIDSGSTGLPRSFEPERFSAQTLSVDTSDEDNEDIHYGTAGSISRSTRDGLSPAFSSSPVTELATTNCILSSSTKEHGSTLADGGHLKANGSDPDAHRMHNGTTVKSIKRMLRDNPPSPPHGREKRTSTRSRRGRGRGRGGRKTA